MDDEEQNEQKEAEENDGRGSSSGTQTVNIFPTKTTDKLAARLLEYTPSSEIMKGNNIAIVDLPKKVVVLFATDSTVNNDLTIMERQCQTSMTASPHVLDPGEIAIVKRSNGTQTDLLDLLENNQGKIQQNPCSGIKTEEAISCKANSQNELISCKETNTENEIINVMANTANKLENQLDRMMEEYGNDAKIKDKAIQNDEFAGHIPVGDSVKIKKANVLCECSCCGPAGNAVPKLGPIKSGPDLSKQIIRLAKNGTCRSEIIKPCSGMADKGKPKKKNLSQNNDLLVDQDGEYADCYLEHLDMHDNEGVQVNLSDEDDDNEEYLTDEARAKKCKCVTQNIEMPWDMLTYSPKKKERPKLPEVKEKTPPTSSAVRFRELTVTAVIKKDLLRDIRNEIKSENFAKENLEIQEIEKQIVEETKDELPEKIVALECCATQYISSSSDEDEKASKRQRLPTRKPSPRQVFDPSCERHNEPYMDRMFRYFPDDCEPVDPCPSHIEMPWNSIILPKCCCIRKSFKAKPKIKKSGGNVAATSSHSSHKSGSMKGSKTKIKVNVSNIPPGTKGELMLKVSGSRIPNKHTKKTVILQGSFSQPYLIQPYKMGPIGSNESQVMRVHNLENKSTKEEFKAHSSSVPAVCCSFKGSLNKKGEKSDSRTDRIAKLLESCKKEMEPIKDGINQLRSRIRELNLPDISNYQEPPQRSGMQSEYNTNYPLISSYTSLVTPDMQYPCMPPWGWGCMPYCQMPCYQQAPNQARSKQRPKPRKPYCNVDMTSSTDPESDSKMKFCSAQPKQDSAPVSDQLSTISSACSKCKNKRSKIPKPCKKCESSKTVRIDNNVKDFESQTSNACSNAANEDIEKVMTTEIRRNPDNNKVCVVNKYRQSTKDIGCCSKDKEPKD